MKKILSLISNYKTIMVKILVPLVLVSLLSINFTIAAGASTLFLDQVQNPTGAYSLSRLSSSYNDFAVRVRRSSDNTEQDIGFYGDDFDLASFNSFVGGDSAYATIIYDQSGNGFNLIQSDPSRQPEIVDGPNGKKIFSFSGSQGMGVPELYSVFNSGDGFTVFVVFKWDGTPSSNAQHIFASSRYAPAAGGLFGIFLDSANRPETQFNLNIGSRIDLFGNKLLPGEWHLARAVFDRDGDAHFWIDGVLVDYDRVGDSTLINLNMYGDGVCWGINCGLDRGWHGELTPPVVYNSALYFEDAEAVEKSISDYYGFAYPESTETDGNNPLDMYELNPTGNPIGGGAGYSNIIDYSNADYFVSTKTELLNVLGNASSNQIIYVDDDAEIDLSDETGIMIPGSVTLASGRGQSGSRGALLFTNSNYPVSQYAALFKTSGPNVRVTGLRLGGPNPECEDHTYSAGMGYMYGIENDHPGLEVDNCEVFGWSGQAIRVDAAQGSYIHHNYIHHNRLAGYGYGIWVARGGMALLEANLFDFNRHHIASSSNPSASWEGRYNIVLEHGTSHKFDRHSSGGMAGNHTWVHHNFFISGGQDLAIRGEPHGEARYYENWITNSLINQSLRPDWLAGQNWWNQPNPYKLDFYNNKLGGISSDYLPVAIVMASTSSGTAPLTVSFDGTSSYDNQGGSILDYQWLFGDGSNAIGAEDWGSTVQYTFNDPGIYNVELSVFNDYGVPSSTLFPVTVNPAAGDYILSAWLKDSYDGSLSNYYRKQVLVDDVVVWEDDVAAHEGWQHVIVDVSNIVLGKENVIVAFRLVVNKDVTDPQNQFTELFFSIDDVHLFGGGLLNGDFEDSSDGWIFQSPTYPNFHWGRAVGDTRSGSYSYSISTRYLNPPSAGEYAEVSQNVIITESPSLTNYSRADLNLDRVVDILDLGIVASNFGRTSGFDIRADTDSNNIIDIFDVVFVASRFS